MEVKMEQLGSDRTVIMNSVQTLRLIMPLASTEANLLCSNANAYVTSCRVQGGEVRADGMLRGSITFEGDGFDTVYSQQEFTAAMPVAANATATAAARIVCCSCRREGSSAVLEAELCISFICALPSEQTVITAINGEDMQVETAQLSSTKLTGIYNQRSAVHDNIELNVRMPQIKQCLQAAPSVIVNETRVEDGEVMLSGDVVLSMLYSCGDEYEPVTQVADKIPFSAVIDTPGALLGDEAFVLVAVEDGTVLPQDNEQGEKRILACDIGINCIACVMRKNSTDIVLNAYSTGQTMERKFDNVCFSCTNCISKQQSVRVLVDKPEDMAPIARICAVNAFPEVIQAKAINGGACLQCRACFQIIYIVSGSGEIASFDCTEEFEMNVDCDCGSEAFLNAYLSTELLQAALLSGSKCELRMVLDVQMLGSTENNIKVLCNAAAGEERECGCGICIYISQKGDSLFTIGEQLGVSLDELTTLNPELSEPSQSGIPAGTRITVFRRLRVS